MKGLEQFINESRSSNFVLKKIQMKDFVSPNSDVAIGNVFKNASEYSYVKFPVSKSDISNETFNVDLKDVEDFDKVAKTLSGEFYVEYCHSKDNNKRGVQSFPYIITSASGVYLVFPK